jgi:hypothetical protein
MNDIDIRLEMALLDLAVSPIVAMDTAVRNYKNMVADHERKNEEARIRREDQQRRYEEIKAEYKLRFGA